MSAVTAKDVAAHCGLAYATVNQILSGGPLAERYNEKTRERVEAVAKELGYRPNLSARSLRNGRFYAAGMILPCESGAPASQYMIRGVIRELAKADMHLMIDEFPEHSFHDEVPNIIQRMSVDGLIVNYSPLFAESAEKLVADHTIPAIWINNKQEFDAVYPDELEGSRRIGEHLLELGHEHAAYVGCGSLNKWYSQDDRGLGCKEAIEAAGGALDWCWTEEDEDFPGELRKLLKKKSRPTVILAYEVKHAAMVQRTAVELGLSIPDDLSLAMFRYGDDMPWLGKITTMLAPVDLIGREAGRLLIQKIESSNRSVPSTAVKHELMPGRTCKRLK